MDDRNKTFVMNRLHNGYEQTIELFYCLCTTFSHHCGCPNTVVLYQIAYNNYLDLDNALSNKKKFLSSLPSTIFVLYSSCSSMKGIKLCWFRRFDREE
jgi:hypothetical protein